jgi:hypothetical protein
MGWQALTPINSCPACGRMPELSYRLFRGTRMVCMCGVAGPFEIGERDARNAWEAVAGRWMPGTPPPNPAKK